MSEGTGPSRRAVLLAAGGALAGLLAPGCGPRHGARGSPGPGPSAAAVDPRQQLTGAMTGEVGLLAAYDATVTRHPRLAAALVPLRAEHEQHRAALARRLVERSGGSPGATGRQGTGGSRSTPGSPSPGVRSTSPGESPPVPAVPAEMVAALRALSAQEGMAAAARAEDCVSAARDLAALLGAIAGSEAAHAALLTIVATGGRAP